MRTKKWLSLLLVMLMTVTTLLTGCGSSGGDTAATEESTEAESTTTEAPTTTVDDKTLRIGLTNDITNLDYAFNYTYSNFHVINNVNDFLLVFDADGNMQPSLCTSWEAVDELTYVYQIRDDAVFSDGTPMTVDDVVFSLQRVMDPEVASDLNWAYAKVASIAATGDWEVTVKLSEPDALWQYIPATPGGEVTSKAYYEAHQDDFGNADGLTLGTGAYKIESWTTGSEIILTKNEYYWGEEPYFDKVVLTVIGDESAMAMAVSSGQIDYVTLLSADLADSYNVEGVSGFYSVPGLGNALLSFNTSAGACQDINLRRAIASCVDVKAITESQFGDYAMPGTAVPFGEGLYNLDPEEWKSRVAAMTYYDYDLDKAKEYLDASDYDGSTLRFVIIENNTVYANFAQVIQATAAQIGINIEIEKVTTSEYYANAYGNDLDENGMRKYDMMINRWTPDYVDPAGDLVVFYSSDNAGQGANYAAYRNDEVDELMIKQGLLTDNAERSELMLQACEIAAEEVPYKALYYPKTMYAKSDRIDYELPGFWLYSLFMKDMTLAN